MGLPELGPEWDPDFLDLWNSAIGFYKIWILHLGRRYNIIQTLACAKDPMPVSELSKSLGLSEYALALWCNAAYSVGLLEKGEVGYCLPPRFIPLLADENDIRFIGGLPSYLALRSLDFGSFDQLFIKGNVTSDQAHLNEAFQAGTLWDHTAFIRLVLAKETGLAQLLRRDAKVLDVGTGTGGWIARLAKRYPSSTFTGIDPNPEAIAKATRCAKEDGLENAEFHIGYAETMGFNCEFDIAYLGEVLNLVKSDVGALEACYKALKGGGTIVICEGLASRLEGARKIENQLVHAMQLDFALQGGRFFTRDQLAELLEQAGFHNARYYDVGGGLWFIVADK